MKILQLDIEGFRSLKKVSWQPGDLNIVIGPNGSGKSNLLRFMELLSVSAQGRLGKYIQTLGGMDPLVWDGQATMILSSLKFQPFENEYLTYQLELARLGKTSSYRITKELLTSVLSDQNKVIELLSRNGVRAQILGENQQMLTAQEESITDEESFLSMAVSPFASDLQTKLFLGSLMRWRIYHDVHVHQEATIRRAAVARSEKSIDPDGQNLVPVLHTLYESDRDFKREVNTAMRAAFGNDFEELIFPPAADQRIQLRIRWKSLKREQSAADLSDGTLRFLLLLTILANPNLRLPVAIDEPETGLHPSMFPIIAEYAVEASKRAQIIFTTHSPQFLDAFTDIKPTTTVAKWENGETQLNTIAGSELDYWLKEYTLGALFNSRELEAMG
ncbi:chromosome segregation protein SMC [candidate division KSB1 bacterium]|nr:MAG: chromosome segregation protein SMC [candidate division KSB1 bacterium]